MTCKDTYCLLDNPAKEPPPPVPLDLNVAATESFIEAMARTIRNPIRALALLIEGELDLGCL